MQVQRAALILLAAANFFSLAAQTPATKPTTSPMRAIYVQDQRDRGVPLADDGVNLLPPDAAKKLPSISWKDVPQRDAERRAHVLEMIRQGQLVSGQDFHDASFVFQHGQSADDYLLAHVLAIESILRGDSDSKWIAAATLDRYLQTIGQKQIFGTQFINDQYAFYLQHRTGPDLKEKIKAIAPLTTQQPYDDVLLPPFVRQDFCVPDLAEQQNYVERTNKKEPAEIPRLSKCTR